MSNLINSLFKLPTEIIIKILDFFNVQDAIRFNATLSLKKYYRIWRGYYFEGVLSPLFQNVYHCYYIDTCQYMKMTRKSLSKLHPFDDLFEITLLRDLRSKWPLSGSVSTIDGMISDGFYFTSTINLHSNFRTIIDDIILPDLRSRTIGFRIKNQIALFILDPPQNRVLFNKSKKSWPIVKNRRCHLNHHITFKIQDSNKVILWSQQRMERVAVGTFQLSKDNCVGATNIETFDRFIFTMLPSTNAYYHYESDQTRASLFFFLKSLKTNT